MFVLAHLSDPHVPSPLYHEPAALLNKRILGFLSWTFKRRLIHLREILDRLREDISAQNPDHVVVTGDIVNISLPSEFVNASDWLETLGAATQVTVIPGNHDAYVAVPWRDSWANFSSFMRSDGDAAKPTATSRFPIVRRRGPVAIIGLSTAVPTAPGFASGAVGAEQLAALRAQLGILADAGLFRVVLLHHPPAADDIPRRKGLDDAGAFCRVIAEAGAELILHGHEHRFRLGSIAAGDETAPVVGVPSASALPRAHKEGAQYHLYCVETTEAGWQMTLRARQYDIAGQSFAELPTRQFVLPRQHASAGRNVRYSVA